MAAKKLRIKTQPRNFSMGGAIGAPVVDPNGSDYDAINAEKTARWAAEDAAQQGIRGPGTRYQSYSAPQKIGQVANQPSLIDMARTGISFDATKQQTPPLAENTFQQDSDARQSRITGYADRLKSMEAIGRANSLMGSNSVISRPSIGYADGGKPIDAEELMRQMTAKYGAPAAGPSTQPPVQQVQQQPKPPASVQPQPQGIVGIIKNRGVQIDKAVNGYARGGKPRGIAMDVIGDRLGEGASEIKGPGTATSDSIPAVVGGTGEPIRVANGERIVSVAQDRFLERYARASGFESLDAMLEAGTGKPVGPTIKAGKHAAADGMSPANYRPEINGVTWTDKSFDPTKEQMAQGAGAIAIKSGQNAGKNVAIGPQNYTAADGSSTSDWSKTAQYAQGLAQAQKDRDTLVMMQRDRLERDAYGADVTDHNVQASARAQIAEQDNREMKKSQSLTQQLENQLKMNRLASEGQTQGLQAQYLAETDPMRREALAERIRGVNGRGTAQQPPQLQHIETENGLVAFNPRTGTTQPVFGADGQALKGSKALTEFQGKSTSYGMRANEASTIIDQVGQGGKVQPSLLKRAAEAVPLIGEGLGMAANKLQSSEQQQIEQAQRDFVNAVLRQESGAAISQSEFDNARKQYFPQPNDTPQVVAQKQRNREMAINGFRISAGPGAKNIGGAHAQPQAAAPKVGMVDGKHVFLGGNPADPESWAEVR